jgi:hypothetical protein
MGAAYVTGDFADALTRPIDQGGYGGYPVLSQLGYQHEIQYLTAGNFNAIIEFLGIASGLEQGLFIPAIVFMNGFRFGNGNWEIAFGPSLSLRKMAKGYYDDGNTWRLRYEYMEPFPLPDNYVEPEFIDRMDSRGDVRFTSRWIWAIGKTFKSGYLNIPVNVYVSPQRAGWYVGTSVGFNVGKRRNTEMKNYNGSN